MNNMKKRFITICVITTLILTVSGTTQAAPTPFTMHTANTLTGNQGYSSVGLEFVVNPVTGIHVLDLGIYDSGQDGILGGGTLSTVIFDAAQTSLVQMDFTAASPGTLTGAYLFKPLPAPLYLAPGTYTIAGYGFNTLNNNHNSWLGGAGPTWDGGTVPGGDLISFVKSVYGGGTDAPGVFPTSPGVPAGYRGDYFDGPNMNF